MINRSSIHYGSLEHTCQSPAKRPGKRVNQSIRLRRRRQLFELQAHSCRECKRLFDPPELEMDHIVEMADGGCNCLINLQLLCHDCHLAKTKHYRWLRKRNETP